MSTYVANSLGRLQLADKPWLSASVVRGALLLLIGVEAAVLVAWLPDTVLAWWRADEVGDFGAFYRTAESIDAAGIYTPRRSLLLHPLTYLDVSNAFRVYTALAGLALLGVAYLAQRGISSWPVRVAIVLGVLSIPQMHWAFRIGHFTPFLALAALSGFLLLRRHPVLAGLCFALLTIKPQYAVVPVLYLLWTRNGRALVALLAGVLLLELAAFAAAGFDTIGAYASAVVDWGADARDDRLAFRNWQYSWPGFLISAGLEPNPLVVFDMIALSLGAVVLVWLRASRSVALPAAALGMMLVTPYANFYDWGLLIVAGALLLRADLPYRGLVPVSLVALYFALLASQASTDWPAVDAEVGGVGPNGEFLATTYGSVGTLGLYWITPVALGVVFLLAIAAKGRRDTEEPSRTEAIAVRPRIGLVAAMAQAARTAVRPSTGVLVAGLMLPAGYFGAAYWGGVVPFVQHEDPFSRAAVVRQLPPDFPLPVDGELQEAGRSTTALPYHAEWTSGETVSQVAALYRALPATNEWDLMLAEEDADASYRARLAYIEPSGFMSHWVMLAVSPSEEGSVISLDFFVTRRTSATLGAADEPGEPGAFGGIP